MVIRVMHITIVNIFGRIWEGEKLGAKKQKE